MAGQRRPSGGTFRSPDDNRDFVYERLVKSPGGKYLTALPSTFDLSKYIGPPRNQHSRSTCAAFAGACIREVQEYLSKHGADFESVTADSDNTHRISSNSLGIYEGNPLSPEFIYYHRAMKPIDGMCGRDVFRILQRYGVVLETDYPYHADDERALRPSAYLYERAQNRKITQYARVTSISGVKRAVFELGPCLLTLPMYENRPEFWRQQNDEPDQGGHAVVIIGYNHEGFKIRNSWGDDWNGDGHVIFPYSDWHIHWECWISIATLKPKRKVSKVKSLSDPILSNITDIPSTSLSLPEVKSHATTLTGSSNSDASDTSDTSGEIRDITDVVEPDELDLIGPKSGKKYSNKRRRCCIC